MENGSVRSPRVSHASIDTTLATVAGRRRACATSGRGWGAGWSGAWIGMLFCHESFKAFPTMSDGNGRTRRGIWPRNGRSPLGPVSGQLGFWPRVPVTVQFGHREGVLQICAWADNGVPRHGAHALRVLPTKTVFEEYLEGGCHGAPLSKGKGANNKIGGERGLRNQDYATRPFATGRIRMVILVRLP